MPRDTNPVLVISNENNEFHSRIHREKPNPKKRSMAHPWRQMVF